MGTEPSHVSQLLTAWRGGKAAALDQLMPLVHAELRRLAGRYLHHERSGHTFDPTDLVHEVYLRLVGMDHPEWRDRAHFYAVAARQMRRILVDHARALNSKKRGRGVARIPLDESLDAADERAADLVALDDALEALGRIDQRKSQLIELRYFGGLTIEETSEVLAVSTATINKDARMARAWLRAWLAGDEPKL